MPRLEWKKTRTLHSDDSILAVSFIDGIITKVELVTEKDVRVSIGEEEFLLNRSRAKELVTLAGQPIKGFLIEYAVPGDGAEIYYFNDFYLA